MPLAGNYFTYNGISSRNYGLFFASVAAEPSHKYGEAAAYHTACFSANGRRDILGVRYETPLEFEAEIVSETPLDAETLREVGNWLFQSPNYAKLEIDSTDYEGIYFNCVLNQAEVYEYAAGGSYGACVLKALAICDAPWGWEEEKTKTYASSEIGSTMIFDNASDDRGYLYPKVIFTTGETGGEAVLQNITDNSRQTRVLSLNPNETVTLTPEPKQILSSTGRSLYSSFNKNFPRFLPGENHFSVTGDVVTLSITYQNARKAVI